MKHSSIVDFCNILKIGPKFDQSQIWKSRILTGDAFWYTPIGDFTYLYTPISLFIACLYNLYLGVSVV